MKYEELPKSDRFKVENGFIESVSISNADHGCLTAWLHIKFSCGGCGFGGYKIGNANGWNLTEKGYAAEWIV